MESLYKGFSCPQELLDEDILNFIVSSYVQEKFKIFLEVHKSELSYIEKDIIPLFETAIADITPGSTWNFALGLVLSRDVNLSNEEILSIVSSTILTYFHCKAAPTIPDLNIQSHKPFDLFIGSMYFEGILSITCDSKRSEFVLNSAEHTRYEFQLVNGKWNRQDIPVYGNHTFIQTKYPEYLDFVGSNKRFISPTPTQKNMSFYEKVYALVRDYAPEYLGWITGLSRFLLITPGDNKRIYSGSDPNWLGIINISYPSSLIAAAEMLVHESSHQIYFVSKFLDRHDDGNYEKLYYSPIKNTGRPIWAILIAYHAFANVVLFYRCCRKNGLKDRGYCKKNELILLPQLQQLEDVLANYDSFTTLGQALWKPLSTRLN